ncbi:histamine H2 receptor-like isoform X2 [Cylas formicarius]|uniref:histamine H2 receptor-like isoform X2 n=1 Tax=Cylas formicarius TaxID=197179 RepID=UPI00295875B6|nr:histamine H2 receptor-like isoform X2 [Cylas formicarius]
MQEVLNKSNPISSTWNCSGEAYCGTNFWFTVNVLITVVTISGNLLTIFAILLSRHLSSMVANQFVFSLAVSDFFVGCSLPYHMAFYVIDNFGADRLNCLLRFLLIQFACSSSICNLLLIATDRTSLTMILVGWAFSFSLAAVLLVWNEWRDGSQCELVVVVPANYMNFIVFPMFVLTWSIMLLLYSRICREATGHAQRIRSSNQSIPALRDSKSFQVMLTILGYFTVFWMPYLIIAICARYYRERNFALLYEVAFNLAVANSGMNPVIYAWKNRNFRDAFLKLIRCKSPDAQPCGANYVTDHVPSKKSSLAVHAVFGVVDENVARTDNGCSVSMPGSDTTDVIEITESTVE